ncbi:hypothetical protein DFH28DRAFT_899954 [Melampsora americana]|nr:hypothetical protein DFH28DRAFT_899954 [Melampsora americana]
MPHLPATHESQCDHHPTCPCDHKVMANLVIRWVNQVQAKKMSHIMSKRTRPSKTSTHDLLLWSRDAGSPSKPLSYIDLYCGLALRQL